MADRESSQLLLVIECLAARLLLYRRPEQRFPGNAGRGAGLRLNCWSELTSSASLWAWSPAFQ